MVPHTTFTYWTGKMPEVIRLCIETQRRTQPNFALVDDKALWDRYGGQALIEALKPCTRDMLRTAQWADLVRLHLLAVAPASSTWLDADCIAAEDLRGPELLEQGERPDIVLFSNRTRAYPNPVIVCRAPAVAKAFRDRAIAKARASVGRTLGYTALGQDVLGDKIMHTAWRVVKRDRVPIVHPFVGHQGHLSSDRYCETNPAFVRRWADHPYRVAHMVNRAIREHATMTEAGLMQGQTLLCEMLRRALPDRVPVTPRVEEIEGT